MDAFNGPNNNGYTPGVSTYRTYFDQNLAVQLGIYKNNAYDSGFTYNTGDNNYSYGGRIHCTPYYDEPTKGRYLVHIGCGGEFRTFNTNPFPNQTGTNVRIRSRGDIRSTASVLDPNFADTGNFYATGQGLLCPELAVVWGPWLFQAEYEESYMVGAQRKKGSAIWAPSRFAAVMPRPCTFSPARTDSISASQACSAASCLTQMLTGSRGRALAECIGKWASATTGSI